MNEPVRIKYAHPPGHVRAPYFLRGKRGIVITNLGPRIDAERSAYRQTAPKIDLYRVRFSMAELWGDQAEHPFDTVDAEIYDNWLEWENRASPLGE